jgi:hypothetical protein
MLQHMETEQWKRRADSVDAFRSRYGSQIYMGGMIRQGAKLY